MLRGKRRGKTYRSARMRSWIKARFGGVGGDGGNLKFCMDKGICGVMGESCPWAW